MIRAAGSILVITVFYSYLESLFLAKCVRKNHKSLLLLGTKIEMAKDINIHPWIKTWVGGLLLSKLPIGSKRRNRSRIIIIIFIIFSRVSYIPVEAEEEVEVEWEEWVPLVPMDGIPDPGGDLIAPSQANSWVAFIKNDWNEDI